MLGTILRIAVLTVAVVTGGRLLVVNSNAGEPKSAATSQPAVAPPATSTKLTPVADVIALANRGRGGLDKILAIHSLRSAGRMGKTGTPLVAKVIEEMVVAKKYRSEVSRGGISRVQTWNGSEGWELDGFSREKEPKKADEETINELKRSADFPGPLVDYPKKGHKVQSMGREKMDGEDCEVLKVELAGGGTQWHYFSVGDGSERKERSISKSDGVEVQDDTVYTDYREFDGVKFSCHQEVTVSRGGEETSKITIEVDDVAVNPSIPDDRFNKPATPK